MSADTSVPDYRMYVDEVGHADFKSAVGPERFLSLTGIIFPLSYVDSTFTPDITALKKDFFGSAEVILHRKELLSGKSPFESLLNAERRDKFNVKFLKLLEKWNFHIITACLDKQSCFETYGKTAYPAYYYCLQLLVERYCLFLRDYQKKGDILCEARGGKEDGQLNTSFELLYEKGCYHFQHTVLQRLLTSKHLKIKPKSANVAGLQLADLLAHPSRNEILVEQKIGGISLAPFAQKIIQILNTHNKYVCSRGKQHGKKYLSYE